MMPKVEYYFGEMVMVAMLSLGKKQKRLMAMVITLPKYMESLI